MADALSPEEAAELHELAEIMVALDMNHVDAILAIERVYFRRLLCLQPSKLKASRAAGMTSNGFRLALRRLQLDDFSPRLPPGDGLVVTQLQMQQGIVALKIHRRAGRPARVYFTQSLTKDELAMVDDLARTRLRLEATAPLEHVRVASLVGRLPGLQLVGKDDDDRR